jgi:transcriptional regulator GlxA family with amidase domain
MRIGVVMVEGAFDSGVGAVLDVLETANSIAAERLFDVERLSAGSTVTTGQRVRHRTTPWGSTRARYDHLVLTAFGAKGAADVVERLPRLAPKQLVRLMERVCGAGGAVHAACTGTWLLASSGLLDGREATTSWWFADAFRRAFPGVRLNARELLVRSGPFTTAGAGFAHVDLALSLLRRASPALASKVSDFLVADHPGSQAPYLLQRGTPVEDPLVQAFERAVRSNLEEPFDLAQVSRALHTSARTLQRRVRSSVGRSPVRFVQHLRLQRALGLLRAGRESVDAIAERVGYQSGHTLRQLLRRELGAGVRELKAAR